MYPQALAAYPYYSRLLPTFRQDPYGLHQMSTKGVLNRPPPERQAQC